MVNLAIRAAFHAGHQPKAPAGSLVVVVCLVIALIWNPAAHAQQTSSPGNGQMSREGRVTRLHDSLAAGEDWDIGVPAIAVESSELSFAELVRAGRALDSEVYVALDRELRQVQRQLQARPADDAARRQLAEIRGALVERIEINMGLDYLYAAAVYVELLRQSGGSADTVGRLSQQIVARRSAPRR